jgi:hypothetical protein
MEPEGAAMFREEEIAEENRRIRRLKFLVDFWLQIIMQADLSREEAFRVIEHVKACACFFFPDKEETFELIYRPRFMRIIGEKYGGREATD